MICHECLRFCTGRLLSKYYILICAVAILSSSAYAQIPYTSFHGSLSLSDEFYSASGIEARRPGNESRGMMSADLTVFDQIQLPFQFYFTTNQTKFQQPFTQFGLNPKFSNWLTLHAGYFSAKISDLTFGDLRLYGTGIELTPGKFRVKILYGRTREAIESDVSRNMPGTFKQTAFAAQIGYGAEGETFMNLNLSHVYDDSMSIKRDSISPKPTENLAVSDQFGIRFSKSFSMTGEFGASLFTNDLHSEVVDEVKSRVPSALFTPRLSTQIDGAGMMSMNITPADFWSLALTGKWIGPGFVTSGYGQMPNDNMEYTANPSIRLFDNRLSISSSLGFRTNNLRNTKLNTTKGFTGMGSVDYQMNSFFGVNMLYNDNEVKSDNRSDLTKISNIFSMFTLSPRFMFPGLGGTNSVILNFTYQDSQDHNTYLQSDTTSIDSITAIMQKTRNQTRSFLAVHSLIFPSSLSMSTSFFYTNTSIPTGSIQIINVNENLSRQFMNNRLGLTLGFGYSSTHYLSTNGQFIASFNASYSLEQYGSLNFTLSNNKFHGSTDTPSYSELQGSLQYTINL